MEEWKWLDKYICQVLLTEEDLICGNAIAAIVHRSEQDAIFQRLSYAEFPKHIQRSVRCLYLASHSGASWQRGSMERYYCDLQVVNSGPPTRIFFDVDINVQHFRIEWHYSSSESCGSSLQQLTNITESTMQLGERRLADYDCVVVDADYGNAYRMYRGMEELVSSMIPHQTFITTGWLYYSRRLVTSLDRMKEMFWCLGGFYDNPLLQTSSSWRIWCKHGMVDDTLSWNLVEMMRWACLDVFWKRSGPVRR
ncbi:hypothetical protein EGR_08864 [Echinococcus granulosus]|uniref:Uncharacterized protein n=1 Tax=Echinococcus granulosus TaxID=6210 RepID=U6JG65_ECHGR|nr:hypothetical protein EGR_08864 [Echinococcus granulosus]EUB56319.1 hypothetical protein EGR_08864 [Echinococcus granulosus]CDS23087.1 hypothetical protein EgrG_002035100 [Echinococcus granulosus]